MLYIRKCNSTFNIGIAMVILAYFGPMGKLYDNDYYTLHSVTCVHCYCAKSTKVHGLLLYIIIVLRAK